MLLLILQGTAFVFRVISRIQIDLAKGDGDAANASSTVHKIDVEPRRLTNIPENIPHAIELQQIQFDFQVGSPVAGEGVRTAPWVCLLSPGRCVLCGRCGVC
jgi:hypothetical protein